MTEDGETQDSAQKERVRIEALARYLCEVDGNHPDRIVSRHQPCFGRNALASYHSVAEESRHASWRAYEPLAVASIDWLKSNG